jgi:hypothetical protein
LATPHRDSGPELPKLEADKIMTSTYFLTGTRTQPDFTITVYLKMSTITITIIIIKIKLSL